MHTDVDFKMRSGSSSSRAASAGGGGSAGSSSHTLEEAMRAPSTNPPDIIVLDSMHGVGEKKETLDLKEDLWLSTADGYVDLSPSQYRRSITGAIVRPTYGVMIDCSLRFLSTNPNSFFLM